LIDSEGLESMNNETINLRPALLALFKIAQASIFMMEGDMNQKNVESFLEMVLNNKFISASEH